MRAFGRENGPPAYCAKVDRPYHRCHELLPRSLRYVLQVGSAGNLTTDAHLAAIAIEHGAELCSCDSDFARFEGLGFTHPLS